MTSVWREVKIVALLCSWYCSTVPRVCYLGVTQGHWKQGPLTGAAPVLVSSQSWAIPHIPPLCSSPYTLLCQEDLSQPTPVTPSGFPMLNIIWQEELDFHSPKCSCTPCTSARLGWQTVMCPGTMDTATARQDRQILNKLLHLMIASPVKSSVLSICYSLFPHFSTHQPPLSDKSQVKFYRTIKYPVEEIWSNMRMIYIYSKCKSTF